MRHAEETPRKRLRFRRNRGKRLPLTVALMFGVTMCMMAYAGISGTASSIFRGAGRTLLETECEAVVTAEVESHYPHSDILVGPAAVPFQIIIMLYMFAGLAVVCDEYFESSLDAICNVLGLSEDVAGATFMAAGSSAPELFTSVMGVFVAKSDVGIGTIVGSAVFNVLIIIGFVALVAGGEHGIKLSWWPLTRDSLFYCLTIVVLVVTVIDGVVSKSEAIICLVMYGLYIVLMKFNAQLSTYVKRLADTAGDRHYPLEKPLAKVCNSMAMTILISLVIVANLIVLVIEFACSSCDGDAIAVLNLAFAIIFIAEFVIKNYAFGFFGYWKDPANAFDGILVGLIIGEFLLGSSGISNLRSVRLLRVFRVLRTLRCCRLFVGGAGFRARGSLNSYLRKQNEVAPADGGEEIDRELEMAKSVEGGEGGTEDAGAAVPQADKADKAKDEENPDSGDGDGGGGDDDDDDDDEPANPFEVPETTGERITWALTLPITVLMFFTVPDCRRPFFEKWYAVTFTMSIIWIGLYSFIMVWMAELFGAEVGIPPPVMGLTILAAGTSIPDTIASVNVAKAGKGDMAVSNSLGSNVFDILIGLGVPWFISTIIMDEPVYILSDSLTISVMILFVTVALVVMCIHISKWYLTKKIGWILVFVYVLYAGQAILTEYGYILSDC